MISAPTLAMAAASVLASSIVAEAFLVQIALPDLKNSVSNLFFLGLSDAIAKGTLSTSDNGTRNLTPSLDLKLSDESFYIPYDICTTIQKIAGASLGMATAKMLGASERMQYVTLALSLILSLHQKIARYSAPERDWNKKICVEADANMLNRLGVLAQIALVTFLSYRRT